MKPLFSIVMLICAKEDLGKFVGETSNFVNEAWKDYQISMKQVKMNPFKETKSFGID